MQRKFIHHPNIFYLKKKVSGPYMNNTFAGIYKVKADQDDTEYKKQTRQHKPHEVEKATQTTRSRQPDADQDDTGNPYTDNQEAASSAHNQETR